MRSRSQSLISTLLNKSNKIENTFNLVLSPVRDQTAQRVGTDTAVFLKGEQSCAWKGWRLQVYKV